MGLIPQSVWTGALAGVAVLSLFGFGVRSCQLSDLRSEVVETEHERDSLAAQHAAQRARADGWEVAFGQNVEALQDALQERDSTLARLSRDYQASRIRVEQLTQLSVEARGTGESQADSTVSEGQDSVPVQWSGRYDDGVLVADWQFDRRPQRAVLYLEDWWASFGVELVRATTGDGRTLVTARTSHPDRVQARIDSLFVDPAPPEVRKEGVSWWWVLLGAGAGAVAQEAGLFQGLVDAVF